MPSTGIESVPETANNDLPENTEVSGDVAIEEGSSVHSSQSGDSPSNTSDPVTTVLPDVGMADDNPLTPPGAASSMEPASYRKICFSSQPQKVLYGVDVRKEILQVTLDEEGYCIDLGNSTIYQFNTFLETYPFSPLQIQAAKEFRRQIQNISAGRRARFLEKYEKENLERTVKALRNRKEELEKKCLQLQSSLERYKSRCQNIEKSSHDETASSQT